MLLKPGHTPQSASWLGLQSAQNHRVSLEHLPGAWVVFGDKEFNNTDTYGFTGEENVIVLLSN